MNPSPPTVLLHDGEVRSVRVELEHLGHLGLLVDKHLITEFVLGVDGTLLLGLSTDHMIPHKSIFPFLVPHTGRVTLLRLL